MVFNNSRCLPYFLNFLVLTYERFTSNFLLIACFVFVCTSIHVPHVNTLPTISRFIGFLSPTLTDWEPINNLSIADNLSYYLSSNLLFNTKVPCSVASLALLCKLPQFYTNLKNLASAMNEKNGIGESKPKQSCRSDVRMLLNR